MKKYLLLVLFISAISKIGSAQFIDNYGLNFGASYSNQLWDYKLISVNNPPGEDYKPGVLVFLFAEKKINNIFSIRPEIGYIQKGFKASIDMRFPDGSSAGIGTEYLVLHDWGVNLGLKINPWKFYWTPYALIGLRADYMFSYRDVVKKENSGEEFEMYETIVEYFSKANLGGLFGIGFEINNLLYFEVEYNPAITRNYNTSALEIKDNCWGAKIGLNINQLLTK